MPKSELGKIRQSNKRPLRISIYSQIQYCITFMLEDLMLSDKQMGGLSNCLDRAVESKDFTYCLVHRGSAGRRAISAKLIL